MRVATNLLFLIIFSFLLSCNSAEVVPREYPFLLLDEITRVNEKGVELSGDLLSQGSAPISEMGFVLSLRESPTTNDRKILSAIQETKNGGFQGRLENDLYLDSLYYVRAFAVSGETTVYSNERTFKSQGSNIPQIDHISPVSCLPGTIITITGDYFSEQPEGNIVTFQLSRARSVEAQVINVSRDTILIRCPDVAYNYLNVPIEVSVEVALQKVLAPAPVHILDPWKKLGAFPGDAMTKMSYITIGSKGYVTLGIKTYEGYVFASKDLWEYSIEDAQWKTLAPFPAEERSGAIGIGIDDFGYVGLGTNVDKQINENQFQLKELKDFWRYDPSVNTWTRLADFPGDFQWMRYEYFTANGKLYLYNTYSDLAKLWVYDPVPDKWIELKVPKPIKSDSNFTHFSINNEVYLLGSKDDYRTLLIWKFNPINNIFEIVDTIPENKGLRGEFVFNIGHKMFFRYSDSGRLMEYDMNSKMVFDYNQARASEFDFNFSTPDKIIIKRAEDNRMLEFKVK